MAAPVARLVHDAGRGGYSGMDATSLAPDAPLPDDVPALQAMVRQLLAEVARLRAETAELRGKLDQALKHGFGGAPNAAANAANRRPTTSRPGDGTSTAARPCPSTSNAGGSSTTSARRRRSAPAAASRASASV